MPLYPSPSGDINGQPITPSSVTTTEFSISIPDAAANPKLLGEVPGGSGTSELGIIANAAANGLFLQNINAAGLGAIAVRDATVMMSANATGSNASESIVIGGVTYTGATVSGSPAVIVTTTPGTVLAGQAITGTGIPSSTTVAAAGSEHFAFGLGSLHTITGQEAWTKTVFAEITDANTSGYTPNLGLCQHSTFAGSKTLADNLRLWIDSKGGFICIFPLGINKSAWNGATYAPSVGSFGSMVDNNGNSAMMTFTFDPALPIMYFGGQFGQGYGELRFDSNARIVIRENGAAGSPNGSTDHNSYYSFGGTLANGGGHRFWTNGPAEVFRMSTDGCKAFVPLFSTQLTVNSDSGWTTGGVRFLNGAGTPDGFIGEFQGTGQLAIRMGVAANGLQFWNGGGASFVAALSDTGAISVSGANVSGLTASKPVFTDGSNNLVSGASSVPQIVASGNLLAQSATVASVATYTTPNDSTKHTFRFGSYTSITAISAGTLTMSVTFTDENGTSRTITEFPMGLTTAGLTATGFTAFPGGTIRCNPNTAITVVATFSGVSITYDVGATIESVY